METEIYETIHAGGAGFYPASRGLLAVWGKEAVQFLDGMITNDMKTLPDGDQMLAAFPNAQGRLLAVVRVLRDGERYLIESEDATREKVFVNLSRFTLAGDFFIEDLSEMYAYLEMFGASELDIDAAVEGIIRFESPFGSSLFVPLDHSEPLQTQLVESGAAEIPNDTFEVLRIEAGVPKFGVDMDETTIVPELGIDPLISYTKGCYIGQEIIARIHFRGHVAKQLTGIETEQSSLTAKSELLSLEGKNAGRITSVTHSPSLNKTTALGYVRYDYLEEGTELKANDLPVTVKKLPFVKFSVS